MMHRRQFLMQSMHGFSGVALAAMLAEDARAAEPRIDPAPVRAAVHAFCSQGKAHDRGFVQRLEPCGHV